MMRGDFKVALLDARIVLKKNPRSEAAKYIVEQSTAALHAPEAMSRRRALKAMETGNSDELLGLADAFIGAEDFVSAERALNKVKAADQNSGRFHDLKAKAARSNRDAAAAIAHWTEAVRLDPRNDEYRLQLAALQIASPDRDTQALGFSAIDRIKVKPEGRLPALRVLFDDAKRLGDKARAREVAELMAADDAAEFSDKLALLTTLQSVRPKREKEFSSYLAQLQQLALGDPPDVFSLISWMIDNDLALFALEWAGKLPPELVSAPPVAPGVAQADARAADWEHLKAKVEAESWGEMDCLRLGFLSLAQGHLGDWKAADSAWAEAIDATEMDPGRLERLAKASFLWDLHVRTEETLWKLATSDWCPRWAIEYLWASALDRGDTAKLYEASKLRLKVQPEDLDTRNNTISLALLTGQDAASARPLAEALHKENPTHL